METQREDACDDGGGDDGHERNDDNAQKIKRLRRLTFCEEEPCCHQRNQCDDGDERDGENVPFDGAFVFQIVLQWRDDGCRDVWKMLIDKIIDVFEKCGDVAR